MKINRILKIGNEKVFFGEADNDLELQESYRLRYRVYAKRDYIDKTKFPDEVEMDIYDVKKLCTTFIAVYNEVVIGSIRIIRDDILPTQKFFRFDEPVEILKISSKNRAELGRFVIVPPLSKNIKFFPRGMIMLFMFDSLLDFAKKNQIYGGYSFVKESLKKKMIKRNMPIKFINEYEEKYPDDGILYKYFNQINDPVIPAYYLVDEFIKYTDKVLRRNILFKVLNNETYSLRFSSIINFIGSKFI